MSHISVIWLGYIFICSLRFLKFRRDFLNIYTKRNHFDIGQTSSLTFFIDMISHTGPILNAPSAWSEPIQPKDQCFIRLCNPSCLLTRLIFEKLVIFWLKITFIKNFGYLLFGSFRWYLVYRNHLSRVMKMEAVSRWQRNRWRNKDQNQNKGFTHHYSDMEHS